MTYQPCTRVECTIPDPHGHGTDPAPAERPMTNYDRLLMRAFLTGWDAGTDYQQGVIRSYTRAQQREAFWKWRDSL